MSRINGDQGAFVQLRDVRKSYRVGDHDVPVLKGINLDIAAGEYLAVVGASGNGKSTLLNMLTGIDHPTSGEVVVGGEVISQMSENQLAAWRAGSVGIVFQFFQLLPALNLQQNVVLPMDLTGALPKRERRERALHLLDLVGLADQAHKLPSTVSGGQQQRAAIARALANDPPLIVADEPTGNLDAATSGGVFRLFNDLVAAGKTLVLVTHNDDLASEAQRVVEIVDGRLFAGTRQTEPVRPFARSQG